MLFYGYWLKGEHTTRLERRVLPSNLEGCRSQMMAPTPLRVTCGIVPTIANAIIEWDVFAHETNYTVSFSPINLQALSRNEPRGRLSDGSFIQVNLATAALTGLMGMQSPLGRGSPSRKGLPPAQDGHTRLFQIPWASLAQGNRFLFSHAAR